MLDLKDQLLELTEKFQVKLKEILERYAEEMYDQETDEGLLMIPVDQY